MITSKLHPAILVAAVLAFTAHAGAQAPKVAAKSAIARLNDEPAAVPTAAIIAAAARPVAVEVFTDKSAYRSGEVVLITVKAAQAGHARIFYRDAAGDVTTLFPLTGAASADAIRSGARIDDRVPGGKAVVISGPGSITGISVEIAGPRFGKEEIAVLVTDFPVKEDHAFLSQLARASSATDAAQLTAGLAIRQDFAAKSARAQLNDDGVPAVLTAIGLASVPITTSP